MWECHNHLRLADDPETVVARARVRVTRLDAGPKLVVAQGNVDLADLRLRVQTATDDPCGAETLIRQRLHSRLIALCTAGQSDADRREWLRPRDFGARTRRGRPEIRRHKVVALRRQTADDAAFVMDAMDYDFHLFCCADTGQVSMIYRCGPTGYRVAPLSLRDGLPRRRAVPITVSPTCAPCLTSQQALARLRRTAMPFVFFADSSAGRPTGTVLYQRYDGHYGLLGRSELMPRTISA